MRPRFLLAATAAVLCLGACTMPLQSRSGLVGTALPPGKPVTIITADEDDGASRDAARAVAAELERRGYVVTPDAPTRIEIALSVRPALTAVEDENGQVISASRNRHRVRLCEGSVHRLALAASDWNRTDDPQPSRGWAEQFRCSGAEVNLARLSRMAVDVLAGNGSGSSPG